MTTESVVLRADRLTRTVETPSGRKSIVVNFSFEFQRGAIYSIIGPSGAGKSSLLRLFNRLDPLGEGEVFFNGNSTREIDPCKLRCCVGYLFQTAHLFPETIEDNIRYSSGKLSSEEIAELADAVEIKRDRLSESIKNLSVGEGQRVALARLLATRPAIALLDEPTSALDPGRTQAIERLVKKIVAERRLTAIVVSHDTHQARRLGGDILLMVDGRLVESGPPEQLLDNPATELGQKFLRGELR